MFKHELQFKVIALSIVLLALGLSFAWGPAWADVLQSMHRGVHLGNIDINMKLTSGQNLLSSDISNSSGGTGSFMLMQKVTTDVNGNETGRSNMFRVDHDGNVIGGSVVALGSITAAGDIKSDNQSVCLKSGLNCPAFTAGQTLGTSGQTITLSGGGAVIAPLATTAGGLAADGTVCSAGQYPLGVDEFGDREDCTTAGLVTAITAGLGLTVNFNPDGGTINTTGTVNIRNVVNLASCNSAISSKIIWNGSGLICATDKTSNDNLQAVTNRGAVTTNTITAAGFSTSGLNIANNIISANSSASQVALNYNQSTSKGFTVYNSATSPLFKVDSAGYVTIAQKLNVGGSQLYLIQMVNSSFNINSNKGIQLRLDADDAADGVNDSSSFAINDANNNTVFEINESGIVTTGIVPWARLNSWPTDCPAGQFLTNLAGGSLACNAITASSNLFNPNIPINNVITQVQAGASSDFNPSITIGSDNLPIVVYADLTSLFLKVAKCLSSDCASSVITPIDQSNQASGASITIGSDNLPIISYQDTTNRNVKVVKCIDQHCGSYNSYVIEAFAANADGTSVTIGGDGLPVIVYPSNTSLKLARCANIDCSSFFSSVVIDSSGNTKISPIIVLGADGLPVIAYFESTISGTWNLKVIKCGNMACNSGNTTNTVLVGDTATVGNPSGSAPAIAMGSDGLPVIALSVNFPDAITRALRVIKCNNLSCSNFNRASITEAPSLDLRAPSLAVSNDGLPIISYWSTGQLKVIKCGNLYCSLTGAAILMDTAGPYGIVSAITIGSDGLPVIAYEVDQISAMELKVVKCNSINCAPYGQRR